MAKNSNSGRAGESAEVLETEAVQGSTGIEVAGDSNLPESIRLSRALLAPAQAADEDDEEWVDPSDEVDQQDKIVPTANLTQKSSGQFDKELAKVGDIYTNTGVNLGAWAYIIPLFFKKRAAYFKDSNLICKSDDGIKGTVFNLCVTCPHSYRKWGEPVNGKPVPPECTFQPTFPAIVVQSENFGVGELAGVLAFQFPKTSIAVYKSLTSDHDQARRAKGGKPVPYYRSMYKLTSHMEEFALGKAAVYDIALVGEVDREMMLRCSKTAEEWSKAAIAEPEAPPADGGIADTVGVHDEDEPPF